VSGGRRAGAPSAEYNILLTATLCLLAFGAVMVFSASSTTRILEDGSLSNSAFFLKRTLLFGTVGLLVMHLASRYGLRVVRALTPAILALAFFLLVAVLAVGTTVNGATRWIGSGFLQIQPSELAKLALVLYGAHMLAAKPKAVMTIGGMMPYLLVVGAACGLVMLEPDLGTTLVTTFAVGAMLIAAGARLRDLLMIALVVGFFVLLAIMFEPYRRERLIGFLNPGQDVAGSGFQAMQAKIALGSGGIFGQGLGDGVQKAFYLPEAHTDMISAVIGEELGLVGIAGVVGLFGLFGYAGFRIAQSARDAYGKLLAAGLTALILVQAVINLYAVMGLAPLTGVPLPFVSYGNSSLMVSLFAVGLILGVARDSAAGAARRPAGKAASAAKRSKRKPAASRSSASRKGSGGRKTARPAASAGRAGKLRVVEGGRKRAGGRNGSSGAKSGDSSRGDSGTRRARHGGRRRASR
jgi:cell division protein FtsW